VLEQERGDDELYIMCNVSVKGGVMPASLSGV